MIWVGPPNEALLQRAVALPNLDASAGGRQLRRVHVEAEARAGKQCAVRYLFPG